MIEVEFCLYFRQLVGQKKDFFEAKDLQDLLKKVVKKYPQLKNQIFENFRKNKIKDHLLIVVNGNLLLENERKTLKKNLPAGARVSLFPPVAGG